MALSHLQMGSCLGISAQGDLGPMTCYTQRKAGKRSIVMFAKIWLSDPTTVNQLNHRNRIRQAAIAWRLLPEIERKNWQRAAAKLSLKLNGVALWTYWHMLRQRSKIETIEHQSGITLITGLH